LKLQSDCIVSYTPGDKALSIDIRSEVQSPFPGSTSELVKNTLADLRIETGNIHIDDFGAPPAVMMAHLETVIKRAHQEVKEVALPAFKAYTQYRVDRTQLRRSRLYLPGNQPNLFPKAGIHHPDAVILDLEDSVPLGQKDLARYLIRNALRVIDFDRAERMVRINQGKMGLQDLEVILPHNVHTIIVPKTETKEQLLEIDEAVDHILDENKIDHDVFIIPILESALGILNAKEIAFASKRNIGLSIGLEDYTAEIGTQRSADQKESLFARNMVVNAARAAGLSPLNSVYSDLANEVGLRDYIRESAELGFEGIGCIHPKQIAPVHEGFSPSPEEIEKAKQIIFAAETALEKGLGVIALGSKMIDPPVVKRAEQTIQRAIAGGILPENWRTTN